jgi:cytochrome c oxidase subunit II
MHVEFYERIWMWAAAALLVAFLGAIVIASGAQAIAPPGHIETVDPTALSSHPEFGKPAVRTESDGTVVVPVVAAMFDFTPSPIEIPAGRAVRFRLTSADVLHGFEIVGTNVNAMAVPGYVTEVSVTFPHAGEYLIACNEYCGLMHHNMTGKLIVRGER